MSEAKVIEPENKQGRLRVFQLGPSPIDKGGVASVLANLLAAQQSDPDLEASVIPTMQSRQEGATRSALHFARALVRVTRECLRRPKPIFHMHLNIRGSMLRKGILVRLVRLFGAPCVLHDHVVKPYYEQSGGPGRAWIRGTLRRADAVITITAYEQEFVESLVGGRVVNVPNPVELPETAARPTGGSEAPVAFLSLTRIMRSKGCYDLVEAMAKLRDEGVPAHLTLAGNGEVETVRMEVANRRLEGCVSLPGWIAGREKTDLLAAADVFVHPTHKDNLPVAVIEASAWGLPVVSTRVGGVPEIVVDGETGILHEAGDVEALAAAMRRLATDTCLRAELGAAGRRRAETRFSLESVHRTIKGVYLEILGSKNALTNRRELPY